MQGGHRGPWKVKRQGVENVKDEVPVHSCRIRVGRSIDGFGLSPGITREQRLGVEKMEPLSL